MWLEQKHLYTDAVDFYGKHSDDPTFFTPISHAFIHASV